MRQQVRNDTRRQTAEGQSIALCKALLVFGNHLSLAIFLMISSSRMTFNAMCYIPRHYLDAIASVQMALSVTQSEFFEIETDDHYTCRIMVS